MGCVSLRSLHGFGLAEVSDEAALPTLDALFRAERAPVCVTPF